MNQIADIPEAFSDLDETLADPIDAGLRAQVPAPEPAEFSLLERIAAGHRVFLMRTGAVIAVSTLVSLAIALLINGLLGGVVAWGIWSWRISPSDKRPGIPGIVEVGGSPAEITVFADGPQSAASVDRSPTLSGTLAGPVALPQLPTLPQLPEASSPPSVASVALPALPLLPGGGIDRPQIAPPLTPGSANANDMHVVNGGTGNQATVAGADDGDVGGESDPMHTFLNGPGATGGGGMGGGSGSGFGPGIDRGLSMFDRQAQPLNQKSIRPFILPLDMQRNLPEKDIRMVISIDAQGAVTQVRVVGSCGNGQIDEMVRQYYQATLQYSPAYQDGKPVASEVPLSYTFHPERL